MANRGIKVNDGIVSRSPGAVIPIKNEGKCWICPEPPIHRGYCKKCYRKMIRGGFNKREVTITVRSYVRNGIIIPEHTQRRIINGARELTAYKPSQSKPPARCKNENCSSTGLSKWTGFCRRCYFRNYNYKKMAERIAAGDIPARPGRRGYKGIAEIQGGDQ